MVRSVLAEWKKLVHSLTEGNGKGQVIIAFLFAFTALWIANQLELLPWRPYSMQNYGVLFLIAWCWLRLFQRKDKRLRTAFIAFGTVFATAYIVGRHLEVYDSLISVLRILLLVFVGFLASAPVAYFSIWLSERIQFPASENPGKDLDLKGFFLTWLALIVMWLPVFLAYYPGLFAYDVANQLPEYLNKQLTTFQTLLHTLYLGFFYSLGDGAISYTTAFALSTIAQALIVAAVLSFAGTTLRQFGMPRWFAVILLFYFGLCPIVSVLAISATKDVLFSAFMLLAMTLAFRLYAFQSVSRKRRCLRVVLIIVSLMFMCLFRNNGIYALAAMLLPLPIIIRKRKLLFRCMMILLASVVLFFAVSASIQAITNAAPGPVNEKYSLPMQCMSRVYALRYTSLNSVVRNEITHFLPNAIAYDRSRSDVVKSSANIAGNEKEFLELWLRIFFDHHYVDYVEAILYTSKGSWYMEDLSNANLYNNNSREGFLLTDTKPGFDVEHISLFPKLENWYEFLFSANRYEDIPLLSIVFMPALYVWMAAFALTLAIYRKRSMVLVFCAFLLLLYVTILLGPCVLIRYIFPYVLCAPFLLVVVSAKHSDNGKREQHAIL